MPLTQQQHVLIVEDSATQRELLRHTLEAHGYTTRTAANAADGLQSIERERPALIISDIVMPGMDGFAFCRAIKGNPASADLPVILLTSLHDPKDVIRGLECGADNFIVKPFDEAYLLSRLEYIASNAPLHAADSAEGVTIAFAGERYTITSRRRQVIDLLLSTYEAATRKHAELAKLQEQLRSANAVLEKKVKERTVELERTNAELRGEIEERKKAEAALRESIGELEAFSYSLSHDMRAPLRAMTSFAELLMEDYASSLDAQGVDYLGRITTAAARLDTLIQDVLIYSRLLRTEIKLQRIDLDALLAQILTERPNLHDANINVRHPLGTIMAHPAALTQCLTNLLDNAVKFSKPGEQPRVAVWTQQTGREIEISIEDHGIGIPANAQRKIFEIFERAHSSSEYSGTGIGLSIVRKAVQRMGGRVGVDSEIGRGSRFWIRLPAPSAESESISVPAPVH